MKKELENLLRNLTMPPFAEVQDVDYKAAMKWEGKQDKNASLEISKDIISMANSRGGYLVIGIKEDNNGAHVEDPLNKDQLKSWETSSVSNFVNNLIDPPSLNLELYRFPHKNAKYIIIKIHHFNKQPFLVKKESGSLKPHHIYYRNVNKQSAPISTTEDWKELFERIFRSKSDQLINQVREVLNPSLEIPVGKIDYNSVSKGLYAEYTIPERKKLPSEVVKEPGFRTVICIPINYKELNYEWDYLQEAIKKASLSFEGDLDWPMIHHCIEQKFKDWSPEGYSEGLRATKYLEGFLGPRYNYWNIQKNGIFIYDTFLEEDVFAYGHDEPPKLAVNTQVFDPELQYKQLAKLVYSIGKYYEALGLDHDDKIFTKIIYSNMYGRKIDFPSRKARGGDLYAYDSKERKENMFENQRSVGVGDFTLNTDSVIHELIFPFINFFQYQGGALNKQSLSLFAQEVLKNPAPFAEWKFLY